MTPNRNSRIKQRRDLDGNPVTNRILCSISDEEFRRLRPSLEFLELHHHRSLQEPAKNVNAAYFINNGLASLIIPTQRGKSVEVGVVGCEGLTGMSLVAGLHRTTARVLIQIAGSGFRVKRSAFEQAVKRSPDLRDRVHEVLDHPRHAGCTDRGMQSSARCETAARAVAFDVARPHWL